jgi:hypothetical protein
MDQTILYKLNNELMDFSMVIEISNQMNLLINWENMNDLNTQRNIHGIFE